VQQLDVAGLIDSILNDSDLKNIIETAVNDTKGSFGGDSVDFGVVDAVMNAQNASEVLSIANNTATMVEQEANNNWVSSLFGLFREGV